MDGVCKGQFVGGKWFVRPVSWEGLWSSDGRLADGEAVLYDSYLEEECDEFIKNYTES